MAPRLVVLLTTCAAAAATLLPAVTAHATPATGPSTVTAAAPVLDAAGGAARRSWAWD